MPPHWHLVLLHHFCKLLPDPMLRIKHAVCPTRTPPCVGRPTTRRPHAPPLQNSHNAEPSVQHRAIQHLQARAPGLYHPPQRQALPPPPPPPAAQARGSARCGGSSP